MVLHVLVLLIVMISVCSLLLQAADKVLAMPAAATVVSKVLVVHIRLLPVELVVEGDECAFLKY